MHRTLTTGFALHHGSAPLHMATATVKASHGKATVEAIQT
jgi:hypothetical protein